MTNNVANVEEKPTEAVNPQQFRLLDLFALMTLVAVVSAMAAPILRGLDSEYRSSLLLVVGLQFLIVFWSIFHYAKRRKRLLDEAGTKIGFGFCGQLRWRHWPVARTILSILYHFFGANCCRDKHFSRCMDYRGSLWAFQCVHR